MAPLDDGELMHIASAKDFEVDEASIKLPGGEEELRFSKIDNVTLNFDTVEDDGVGGTVVFQYRLPESRGFYSGAPISKTKWFVFDELAKPMLDKLKKRLAVFDITVTEESFRNDVFQQVYLDPKDQQR